MKKFLAHLFHFSLVGLIPSVILTIVYIVSDPFKVLKSYHSYYDTKEKGWVGINKDFVSTSTLINNRKSIRYNSFILGNSRSIFYQISDWKKHLPENSVCFHFDASSESLWALEKKISFIDHEGMKMENVLIILDNQTLSLDKPKSGHLFITSPKLVNNSNIVDFHKTFFYAFVSPKFLYAFIDFKISGVVKSYMKDKNLLDDKPRNYELKTNEMRFDYFEDLIRKNKYYNTKRLSVFYKRGLVEKYSPIVIQDKQKEILNKIQYVFKNQHTKVKIVISPLYNQKKMNKQDVIYLRNVFGAENVFDFSGINNITNNYQNYYESSHYRPHVARGIMEEIYKK